MVGTYIVLGILAVLALVTIGVYFSPVVRAFLRRKRDKAREFSAAELREMAEKIEVKQ